MRATRARFPSAGATTGHERPRAGRGASAATARFRGHVDPRRDHHRLRHPADRVVAADDLGVGLLPVRQLLRRLAADVRAEIVEDRPLPERAQDRELQRLRDERETEDEVEDVGLWHQLAPARATGGPGDGRRPSFEVQRAVGLGVEGVAVEDDEPRVDPAVLERLRGRPGTPAVLTGQNDARNATVHAGGSGGGLGSRPVTSVGLSPRRRQQSAQGVTDRHTSAATIPEGGRFAPRRGLDRTRLGPPASRVSHGVRPTRAGRSSGAPFCPDGSASAARRARRPRSRRGLA